MREQMLTVIAALIRNGKDNNYANTYSSINYMADHWPNLTHGDRDDIKVIANAYAISVGILKSENIPNNDNMTVNQTPTTFGDLYR